jgi:CRISPR type III-A-associated RAMP protein Csm4
MLIEALKLRFGNSPLHLGRGGDELDKTELIYHSDSLKSAIYSVGLEYFPHWKDPDYFFSSFRIGSCFPFAGTEYFLPRPNIRKAIVIEGVEDDLVAKKVKKISFLSLRFFENFLDSDRYEIYVHQDHLTVDQGFVCEKQETCFRTQNNVSQRISFYKTEVQQRVQVPHQDSKEDSKPFFIDRIYFERDCGLYFFADFKNWEIREQVLKALSILGERGIGTDRTVGNGLFSFDPEKDCENVTINLPVNKNGISIPLGLYLPTEAEISSTDLSKSSWSLLKRGGFMGGSGDEQHRHLRKKSIYMFGEGSAFFKCINHESEINYHYPGSYRQRNYL